jgi:dolichol-phosphate mannosyltransferase
LRSIWEKSKFPIIYYARTRDRVKRCLPIIIIIVVFASNQPHEIIVIDDNSPDGTNDVAKELQKLYGEDKVVLKPRSGKLGLGTAYIHGLKYARGNFVVLMDSDLSHHVSFFSLFRLFVRS